MRMKIILWTIISLMLVSQAMALLSFSHPSSENPLYGIDVITVPQGSTIEHTISYANTDENDLLAHIIIQEGSDFAKIKGEKDVLIPAKSIYQVFSTILLENKNQKVCDIKSFAFTISADSTISQGSGTGAGVNIAQEKIKKALFVSNDRSAEGIQGITYFNDKIYFKTKDLFYSADFNIDGISFSSKNNSIDLTNLSKGKHNATVITLDCEGDKSVVEIFSFDNSKFSFNGFLYLYSPLIGLGIFVLLFFIGVILMIKSKSKKKVKEVKFNEQINF